MKYEFPKDFKWGSAVWAQGTEGAHLEDGKALTVFEEYYRQTPERFFNYVGPNETLNWYHDYQKYVDLAADIKHNSFRTSILWARLLPDGKNVNEKAVKFYKDMFKAFKEKGMELSIVLYWFDMPLLFENKGGFTNRETIEPFAYYCQKCFELFDGLVDIWYIYNEPIVDVNIKYQNDMCYPNYVDFNLANKAIYHMVVAHAKVVELFKKGNYYGEIGSVVNHASIYERSQNEADLKAKHELSLIINKCFDDPFLLGEINQEWYGLVEKHGVNIDILEGDKELIKNNTIKVLGLNIYSPTRVTAPRYALNAEAPITFDSFSDPYVMPGRQFNKDRGWEIYPKCIYDTIMFMKNEYNNPEMRITENGMGVQDEYRFRDNTGKIQDNYRIEYVKSHLEWVHKAITEGANLVGYNMWSFIDLWSPSNQFKNCYGFYEYNLETGESKRKKSADWFQKITEDNGFE